MKIKRFTTLFLFLSLCLSLFANDYWTVDSVHKQVTAFKRLATDPSVPADQEFNVRIINANDATISYESEVVLPEEARGDVEYNSFRFVLYGNIYGSIQVTFYYGPMVKGGLNNWSPDASVSNSVFVIPYEIEMVHSSTRMGNTLIGTTKRTAQTTAGQLPIQYNYCNTIYDFFYADSVSVTSGVSVERQTRSISFTYNLKTNTYVEGYPSSAKVCSYWNRYGSATMSLGVTNDMLAGAYDGTYYANVSVYIETGN